MSEINCDCGYNYTQTGCPNCKHVPIDCTEETEKAIANMQREYDRRGRRIAELQAKLNKLLAVSERALMLSLKYSHFKLHAMEPMHRAIAAVKIKGEKDE